MITLLSSFPTSIFTGALAFCLTWWIVTSLVSGFDSDADADTGGDSGSDAGSDSDVGSGHGDASNIISDALAIGYVPLPLALTVIAFGAWSISLILQLVLGADDTARLAAAAAVIVLIAALAGGVVLLRLLRGPLARLFQTVVAPSRSTAVGATCRVRTLAVTDRLGDAEVLTGPTRGSLIKVRADEGRFTRGDIAVIIDYDRTTEAFVIDEIDKQLLP